jgi:hypothetical protein
MSHLPTPSCRQTLAGLGQRKRSGTVAEAGVVCNDDVGVFIHGRLRGGAAVACSVLMLRVSDTDKAWVASIVDISFSSLATLRSGSSAKFNNRISPVSYASDIRHFDSN